MVKTAKPEVAALGAEDCATLTGYFEATDRAREEAYAKWGFGRLEKLAPADLLARFRRQQATWSAAYQAAWTGPILTRGLLEAVQQKSAAMVRAWSALDAAATEAGHRAVAPWVWEVPLADGSVAAFVQSDAEASRVIAEGRYLHVYTPREVGNLIDVIPSALLLAKQSFPGAKFQGRRFGAGEEPEWLTEGDPIPF